MAYTGCLILISLFGIGAYGSTSVMPRTQIDVHYSEMSDGKQREALQVALLAVNMYTKENDIANYIMKEFERRHGGYWNCIIGCSGFRVRHDRSNYIEFSVGDKKMALFRSD